MVCEVSAPPWWQVPGLPMPASKSQLSPGSLYFAIGVSLRRDLPVTLKWSLRFIVPISEHSFQLFDYLEQCLEQYLVCSRHSILAEWMKFYASPWNLPPGLPSLVLLLSVFLHHPFKGQSCTESGPSCLFIWHLPSSPSLFHLIPGMWPSPTNRRFQFCL